MKIISAVPEAPHQDPARPLTERIRRYFRWKRHGIIRRHFELDHPLGYLFFEVTRRCNLQCVYCGSNCEVKAQSEELTTKEWIDIARQVARDFDPTKIMIAITGGEPLLKPGILDLYHELYRLRFPFGMVTNGTKVTPEMARKVVQTGMGSITVSMDAPPAINDTLRGKGISRKAEAALRNFQQAGYKGKLEVCSTITKAALPHLDEMRSWLVDHDVTLWRMAAVMPIGRAAEREDLMLNEADVRYLLQWIKTARKDRTLPVPEFGEEGYLGETYEGEVRPYLAQCDAGIRTAGIRCNGHIAACPELPELFDQGDIRTERFKDVWDTRYQLFRDRSWTQKGDCATCKAYGKCKGGALHLYTDQESPFLRCLYLMDRQAAEGEYSGCANKPQAEPKP